MDNWFSTKTQRQLRGRKDGLFNKWEPWLVQLSGLSADPNAHHFDSQSGHMPGLQARPPVQSMQEATTH